MRLQYYKKPNFGDALNPIIFKKLLPDFFDKDPEHDFFGIGSIAGLSMVKKANKKIIFSSGFAYGSTPVIDSTYDVICVRGPLSAKALNIENKFGIADGALLLRELKFNHVEKEYNYSFMPHWESEKKYSWERICEEAGVNYVSPTSDPHFIIEEILKSKCVIAEAMHFAIVADTLRVPWIPVKAYPTISEFKWKDWSSSLEMEYNPISLPELYDAAVVKDFLKRRSPFELPEAFYELVANARLGYENILSLNRKALKGFEKAKKSAPYLSKEFLFNSKVDQLLERLDYVRKKY